MHMLMPSSLLPHSGCTHCSVEHREQVSLPGPLTLQGSLIQKKRDSHVGTHRHSSLDSTGAGCVGTDSGS